MSETYFATVARGLEEIAAKELGLLGATEVKPTFTGVYFQGNQQLFYRVLLTMISYSLASFWLVPLILKYP